MQESPYSLEAYATPEEAPPLTVAAFPKPNGSLDLMGVKVTAVNPATQSVWAVGGYQEYPGGWVTPGDYVIAVNPPGIHSGFNGRHTGVTRQFATVYYRVHSQTMDYVTATYPTFDPTFSWLYTDAPTYGSVQQGGSMLPNQLATATVTLQEGDSLQVAYGNPWYGFVSMDQVTYPNNPITLGNPYGVHWSNGTPKSGAITSIGADADTLPAGFLNLAKAVGSDGTIIKCSSQPEYRSGMWASTDSPSYNVALWEHFKNIAIDKVTGWGGTTYDGITSVAAATNLPTDFQWTSGGSASNQALQLEKIVLYRAHAKLANGFGLIDPNNAWSDDDEEITQRILEFAFNVPQHWGMHGHENMGQRDWLAHGYGRYAPYEYGARISLIISAAALGKDPSWEPLHHMLASMAQAVDQASPFTASFQYANGPGTTCTYVGGTHINGAPFYHKYLRDLGYSLYLHNGEKEDNDNPGFGKTCGTPIQPGGNPSWGGPGNTYYGRGSHRLATWGYSVWARAILGLPTTPSIEGGLWHVGSDGPFTGSNTDVSPFGCLCSDDGGSAGFSTFYPHLENRGATALWALFPRNEDPYNVRASRFMKNHHKSWFFKYFRNQDGFENSTSTAGRGEFDSQAWDGWIPAPENVQATDNGNGTVNLTWDAVVASTATTSEAATSYNLYRSITNPTVVNSNWRSATGAQAVSDLITPGHLLPAIGGGDGRNDDPVSFAKEMVLVGTTTDTFINNDTPPGGGTYYYAISANSSTAEGVQSEQAMVSI